MREDITMNNTRIAIVLALALLALLAPGCEKKSGEQAGPAATKAVKLTYANFPPAATFPCVQMERWKQEVEKRTNGKVTIETYPNETLLDAKGMMDGVVAGQADIGCLCMSYQPGRFAVTNATSLPLGIPNAKVGSQVLWDLYNKYKPGEFKDVKVLTMFATAPSNIMSRKAIRTLDNVKGCDLRASGGAAEILKAWGANQVGMPMSDTPEALQKGTVQGLFSSVEVMKDFKFAEQCKFVTLTDTVIYPFAVVMNKAKWDSLPADVQKVMEDLAAEQCVWTGEYMDNHCAEALDWSKREQQVEVITLSAEEKAKWDASLAPITAAWIEANTQKGLPADQIVADSKAFMVAHRAN